MKKFIKIMTGFMNRMAQDHVSAFAAQAAFFILMSFVPEGVEKSKKYHENKR